ncbi:tetratricopeptide repeat protein [Fodinibius saliphilus]|uniref:tetratricopeptide repeat protein n=1 Tax=Fodinibius saliphilus TaxID=1920650 RepID=UPI001107E73E|nr:tetratricopeptide repeat protein [Fodinibius saliphilus]
MKCTISIFLMIFMGSVSGAHASFYTPSYDTTNYENELEKGIEAFYQTDWDRAETIFDKLQQKNPKDSRAYFFSSMIPFWTYYFGDTSEQAANLFLKRSEQAIRVSRNQLKQHPRDTTMVLMLSGLYGYRSLVAASQEEYRTAIESGMTGFKYTRQLLMLDADDPRALIGKGMFYYMVGSVPNGLKWVTNMIGFSGDTEAGFSALKKAATSDSYVSNDAKMILAYLYKKEEQPQKALPYLEKLVSKYPKNIIFQFNLAEILEKCGYSQKARKRYQKVMSMNAIHLESLRQESHRRLQ